MPQPVPLRVVPPAAAPPLFLASARPVEFGPGFYAAEHAEGLPFRWMSLEGRLAFTPAAGPRFLELWVRSNFHDLSQRVVVAVEGAEPLAHDLVYGWNAVSVPVPPGAGAATLQANRLFPREYYPGDGRALAVQVRSEALHEDAARHGHVARQQANTVLNRRELLQGRVSLMSHPPKLGVDMTGACNVKPPCVYCAWDFNKALEGDNVDLPFSTATLEQYGGFFDDTQELVNCSIGEPFMMKNVDELLEQFSSRGKVLELTTNGQILTDTNIAKLLGHNAHLYISLDAATPETYARLRNPTFTRLLDNVRRLVKAKGGRGRLPLVYLVFMPMKANVHEVDAFVKLAAELGADRLVLRPLNDSEGVDLKFDRSDYHFDYQQEILPFPELVRISGRVAELCRRYDLELSDQMDFGGSLQSQFAEEFAEGRRAAATLFAEPVNVNVPVNVPVPVPESVAVPVPLPSLGEDALPACTEPWNSLYVLRRGTMPCCYGGKPIAPMAGFKEAWNGPLMQDIRRELLKGRFHPYCFDSPDCPIVRKAVQAQELSSEQRIRLWAQRAWARWARRGYGWPGHAYRRTKHRTLNALGHVRTLFGRPSR
jgi:MoaA/NifB/PqqE/SkfB family radical SAM enzyme